MRQLNIDEIKAQLPSGIWFLTGGSLKLQRLLKNTYKGDILQKKLDQVKVAMKLQLKDKELFVTLVHRNGEIMGRILPRELAAIYPQGNGDLHLLIEKKGTRIDANIIEESLKKVTETGLITGDEYIRYSDPNNWDELPRIEFEMVVQLP